MRPTFRVDCQAVVPDWTRIFGRSNETGCQPSSGLDMQGLAEQFRSETIFRLTEILCCMSCPRRSDCSSNGGKIAKIKDVIILRNFLYA